MIMSPRGNNGRSLNCKHFLFFFTFANIAGLSKLPGLKHGNVEVLQVMVQGSTQIALDNFYIIIISYDSLFNTHLAQLGP